MFERLPLRLSLLFVVTLLIACGNKGDLFVPDDVQDAADVLSPPVDITVEQNPDDPQGTDKRKDNKPDS